VPSGWQEVPLLLQQPPLHGALVEQLVPHLLFRQTCPLGQSLAVLQTTPAPPTQ
jgi:hypothetical protein